MQLRPWRVAHLAALALIAAVAPGCPSNKNIQPPAVQATIPLGGSIVGRTPLIVFQFDRPMDPAFVNTTYISFNLSGTNTSIGSYSVENLPELNEARIIPGVLLTPGQAYDVFCQGTIQSAKGTQMGSAEGITITVEPAASANATTSPVWSGAMPAQVAGGTSGQIVLSWAAATETLTTPPGTANVPNYDCYLSPTTSSPGVSGFEDYFVTTAPLFQTISAATGGTLIGLTPATDYYIKVVPRDNEGNVINSPVVEFKATSNP